MDSNPFYRMFIIAETTSILVQTVKLVFTELVMTAVSIASLMAIRGWGLGDHQAGPPLGGTDQGRDQL